ncbi:cuticle protein 16.8, partial [Trichonephila clavata]
LLFFLLLQLQLLPNAGYAKPDEIKYPPQPYQFGYDSNDEYGNTAYRKEAVMPTAEAQVKTNEPGTESKSPADIELYANPIVVNYVPQPQRISNFIIRFLRLSALLFVRKTFHAFF